MPRVATLTPRQREVAAELAADGATNAEIGERLGMSEWTVKTHMQAIRQATGFTDRAALAVALVRRQVVVRVNGVEGQGG